MMISAFGRVNDKVGREKMLVTKIFYLKMGIVLTLSKQTNVFTYLQKKVFSKYCGQRRNCIAHK